MRETGGRWDLFAGLAAVVFWITGWFPVTPDGFVFAAAGVALLAVIVCARWQSRFAGRALRLWSGLVLLAGLVSLAFVGGIVTSAEASILAFHILGWAAFPAFLSGLTGEEGRGARAGLGMLLALPLWSWGSALAMAAHRGAEASGGESCILSPVGLKYVIERRSLWDMRLPEVISAVTGPTGSVILEYHAVLVVPGDEPRVYNWSKRRLRFEPLDLVRNPYVPRDCP